MKMRQKQMQRERIWQRREKTGLEEDRLQKQSFQTFGRRCFLWLCCALALVFKEVEAEAEAEAQAEAEAVEVQEGRAV